MPAYLNGHPDGMLLEAPAGLLDGDDPETAIRREAEEETGYRVAAVTFLGEYFMSPGSVTERIAFFSGSYRAGERVSEGGGLAGEGEDIEVVEVTLSRGRRHDRAGRDRRRQDRAAAPPRTVHIASREVTRPETPFADAVDAFLREAPTAFSTPGHKRNPALIGDDRLLGGRLADARRCGRPARRQAHPRARRATRRRGLRRRSLPLLGQRLDASQPGALPGGGLRGRAGARLALLAQVGRRGSRALGLASRLGRAGGRRGAAASRSATRSRPSRPRWLPSRTRAPSCSSSRPGWASSRTSRASPSSRTRAGSP